MGKYDNLDKSEEVSSTQKKGRHTFRKLVGDFFDNVHSAIFDTMLGRPLLILAVAIIAIIIWFVLGHSMGWVSFAEVPSEDTVDSVKSIMILICIITIIGHNLNN